MYEGMEWCVLQRASPRSPHVCSSEAKRVVLWLRCESGVVQTKSCSHLGTNRMELCIYKITNSLRRAVGWCD